MNTNNEISDLVVKAYKHQKNGDLSLAIQGWNALINHSSTDKELISNAFLNLGNLHLQQGNGDLAYESMAKAISSNPNSSEAFFCMAYMEQEKENFNEAINFFEAALKLKPKDVGAINNLGNCYDRLNAADKAINTYSKAISIDSSAKIGRVFFMSPTYIVSVKKSFSKRYKSYVEVDSNLLLRRSTI